MFFVVHVFDGVVFEGVFVEVFVGAVFVVVGVAVVVVVFIAVLAMFVVALNSIFIVEVLVLSAFVCIVGLRDDVYDGWIGNECFYRYS